MTRLLLLAAVSVSSIGCGSEPAQEEDHESGAPDVVVLDSLQLLAADLSFATVQVLPPDTLRLTGTVTFDAARVSHVGPRMQGRLVTVPVEIGTAVRAGDTLAVLDSPELGAAQAAWFTTFVDVDVSRRNYERAERLYRDGIVSERRRLEAEGAFRQADANLAAARRALAAMGAEPDSTASSLFVLRAPLTGIVADKHATVGEVVGPESGLFTVGNLSRLWIILDVYESDLRRVSAGVPVMLMTEAYPGLHFEGRVTYVGAIVDTTSRTVKVRVEIPNADRSLKPGMFARADLVLVDTGQSLGVPLDAIQTIEDRTVVFVPEQGGRFRATPVIAGRPRAGGWVEISDGLALGDRVVTRGSFTLKADLQKESFGEGGH